MKVLISQTAFLNHKIAIADDTVLRVNCAWVRSQEDLVIMLNKIVSFKVFIDLPTGRTKPPKPVLDLEDIGGIIKDYLNIEYFGLTNVTEVEQIEEVRYFLPDRIKIVPKIESKLGVERLHSICEALQDDEHYLMLDKEDLYTDVLANSDVYQGLIEQLYKQASLELKIVIELQGVIFAERKR